MERGAKLTIRETADLYGISVDTLYYYEKIGLVVPKRCEKNRYRMYSAEEFARLNIITTLSKMHFSNAQIKNYFSNRTLSSTMLIFHEELLRLNDEFERLRRWQGSIESAFMSFASSLQEVINEEVVEVDLPERPYLTVCEGYRDFKDFPYLLALKSKELNFDLNIMHAFDTFIISGCDGKTLIGKDYLLHSAVPLGIEDKAFPAGHYLSITFRGQVDAGPKALDTMLSYIEEHGYEACGDFIVYWIVDETISDIEAESIQRMQVRVEKKDSDASTLKPRDR